MTVNTYVPQALFLNLIVMGRAGQFSITQVVIRFNRLQFCPFFWHLLCLLYSLTLS